MPPIWLRVSHQAVEIGVVIIVLTLGGMIFHNAIGLGSGWGESGPQPGFFPFFLTFWMVIAAAVVLVINVKKPDRRPFFKEMQEVTDLLKVGIPIAITVLILPWAGLYITSGAYLAFFMAWYGRFRWYQALAGGILLPLSLWFTLRVSFNINMPLSVFYKADLLPF